MPKRIRTFIALELTKPIRQRLVAMQEKLAVSIPEVKWVEPENLHVTLLFLGEVPDSEVPEVCQRVAEAVADVAPFPVKVEGFGAFPEGRRPRVLWAGITTGAEQLQHVHDLIEKPLHYMGFRREERRYVPHITLGRLKSERPVPNWPELVQQMNRCRGGEMVASEICIMASQLERTGPIYTVMGRARFGGETPVQETPSLSPGETPDPESFLEPGDEPWMD
jgi:2'-5' RNA ligase